MGRDKGRGKRGGHRGGRGFSAQSAEEIEQRNQRLAAFDEQRAWRRAEEDDGGEGEVESGMAGVGIDDDDDEPTVRKAKGVEGLIEVDNPNKAKAKSMKISDLGGEAPPMTRREREEKEREAKKAAYRKRHEMGLTEEYKTDMKKLAEVKARREAAQAKKSAEEEAKKLAEEERLKKMEAMMGKMSDDSDEEGDKKKKKKSGSSKKKKGADAIEKLDKITIKKMKPAQLKEALKERGLDIQGNAKALTSRLLEFETNR